MKKWYIFLAIVTLMAFMDGLNFHFPHNNGWLSFTYGEGSNNWDAWHVAKRTILALVFYLCFGLEYKTFQWWKRAGIYAGTAYAVQYLIFDWLSNLI